MKLEHCQYMLEIYKTGSINKAAENLYTSPQNVSRIKTNVENKLNTKIFKRSNNTLQPTENGRIFLKFCNRALTEYADVLNTIQKKSESRALSGTISIRTTTYVVNLFLNNMIFKFKSLYPDIKIEVILSHTR